MGSDKSSEGPDSTLTNPRKFDLDTIHQDFSQYRKLGGFLHETDYRNIIEKAKVYRRGALETGRDAVVQRENLIAQTNVVARKSGITLSDTRDSIRALYKILNDVLRKDAKPGNIYDNIHMSDQRLFAEALRILGDKESLQKLIEAHPNINLSSK